MTSNHYSATEEKRRNKNNNNLHHPANMTTQNNRPYYNSGRGGGGRGRGRSRSGRGGGRGYSRGRSSNSGNSSKSQAPKLQFAPQGKSNNCAPYQQVVDAIVLEVEKDFTGQNPIVVAIEAMAVPFIPEPELRMVDTNEITDPQEQKRQQAKLDRVWLAVAFALGDR